MSFVSLHKQIVNGFILSLFFSAIAQAEFKVIPGEYVVTRKQSSVGAYQTQASVILPVGLQAAANLDTERLLVRDVMKSAAALSLGTEAQHFEPYDPNDTGCARLMAAGFDSCSPNYELKISATTNDTNASALWGMRGPYGLQATTAWDLETGSEDIVVAVIDTGVDYTHPDLAANMWVNTAEIPGNNIDDDGNGIKDDIYGAKFVSSPNGNPMDDNSHGTHVAGTIGAVGNNGLGVVGVNWRVKIMALKFLSSSGSGSLSGAIQAINYMVMMKARGVNIRVVNNSWGGGGYSQPLYDAIARARDAGIIFTAAAGNESNDNDQAPAYPASYDLPNVVSVAAIDSDGNLAGFSNYGASNVDIAAPGVDILSTTPGGTYATYSGTSMATPHVTGALALLLTYDPSLSAEQAIARLYESGMNLASLNGLVRTSRTANVNRMLRNMTEAVPEVPATPAACTYSMEVIPYAPDYSADAAAIAQQADELNYLSVALPFGFRFKNSDVTSIKVSPNGVLYTKNAPMLMDYQNGQTAAVNSIAALHTDLVATPGSDLGVRVYADSAKAVVYWKARGYGAPGEGLAEVRARLAPDGSIESHMSFSDEAARAFFASRSTIGVNGAAGQGSDTYSANTKSKIAQRQFAVRFFPVCNGGDAGSTAQVSKVKLVSASKKSILRAGEKFSLSIKGAGTGAVNVSAKINGQLCVASTSAQMQDGKVSGVNKGRFPATTLKIKSFAIVAGGVEGKSKVYTKARSSKVSAKKVQSLCAKVIGSLH